MQAAQPGVSADQLTVIATLAAVVERLEHSKVPVSAAQYRSVVQRLMAELTDVQPDAALKSLFEASTAATEIYENLHYQHAGLCLKPLDQSLEAELSARRAIDKAKAARAV
jgi:hemoglobin-like flavoprotein